MDSNEVRSSQNYIPFKEQQKPELFDDMVFFIVFKYSTSVFNDT